MYSPAWILEHYWANKAQQNLRWSWGSVYRFYCANIGRVGQTWALLSVPFRLLSTMWWPANNWEEALFGPNNIQSSVLWYTDEKVTVCKRTSGCEYLQWIYDYKEHAKSRMSTGFTMVTVNWSSVPNWPILRPQNSKGPIKNICCQTKKSAAEILARFSQKGPNS